MGVGRTSGGCGFDQVPGGRGATRTSGIDWPSAASYRRDRSNIDGRRSNHPPTLMGFMKRQLIRGTTRTCGIHQFDQIPAYGGRPGRAAESRV